jgi:hypothetical protein
MARQNGSARTSQVLIPPVLLLPLQSHQLLLPLLLLLRLLVHHLALSSGCTVGL